MIEVNANAQHSRRHKLRSSGDSSLTVDGGLGFVLLVEHVGGDDVTYSRPGTGGASATLQKGQQVRVTSRTVFTAAGEKSVLDITKPTTTPVAASRRIRLRKKAAV